MGIRFLPISLAPAKSQIVRIFERKASLGSVYNTKLIELLQYLTV